MHNPQFPNVVVIGGGTGTYSVLSGLRDYPVNLTAVVTMMDSGGSTGRLRDQLGMLPPGDIRQALVALSESSQIWRDLFTFRFSGGDLDGHNFGNIFISALDKVTGSFETALEHAARILDTKGEVLPVTYANVHLCAKLEDGSEIEREATIDEPISARSKIKYAYLKPEAQPNPKAIEVIRNAHYIILGPGDIYTSLISNLLVNDVASEIRNSKAKKIYIVNLMTKPGQTDDFTAKDHVIELEKYLGTDVFDYVLVNETPLDTSLLDWYQKSSDSTLVTNDLHTDFIRKAKIVRGDVLSQAKYEPSLSDRLKRSLIRHDYKKLGYILAKLVDTPALK